MPASPAEVGRPTSPPAGSDDGPLLAIRGLRTHFETNDGIIRAVDGIDLQIERGRTLCLVGESGCGKSVTALSIMRLLRRPGKIVAGQIKWHGRDLLTLSENEMRAIRGAEIAMIFQEPMTALNPVLTAGDQIGEMVRTHWHYRRRDRIKRATEMLRNVGIPQPEQRLKAYPHELSGGMRQRLMIGIALACEPQLLLADEPVTAVDVTIQAQILRLITRLRDRTGMALLLITHDLGVVAEVADDVAMMYAGQIVEQADVNTLFAAPKHPYTKGLLESIPTLATDRQQRLNVIRGTVPHMLRLPKGCLFEPRCPFAMNVCREVRPEIQRLSDGRVVRCHLYPEPPPGRAGEPVVRSEPEVRVAVGGG